LLEGANLKRLLEQAGTPDIERTQAYLFAGLEAQGTPLAPFLLKWLPRKIVKSLNFSSPG